MKLGMIGLGKMGANMAERLRSRGHEVVGMDPVTDGADVRDLPSLVEALGGTDGPRVAWSMVPHGEPTDETITGLADLLAPGDVVVDGGNSNHHETARHGALLAERGIHMVDCGTSGGVWGRDEGYALMVGGTEGAVAILDPILTDLAPPNGYAHVGPVGAGHFVKMVHNGVEYGMMQAFAEGYAILDASPLDVDIRAALGSWQQGSVVRSWLLDLLVRALDESPDLAGIASVAADSGEGRWTVQDAVDLGVPAPVISAALFARFASQRRDDDVTMKVVSALRHQFGGHTIAREPNG